MLALAGSALLCAHDGGGDGGGGGQPHPPERTNGAYKITFAGYLQGSGTATVSGEHLIITGSVKPPSGRSVNFQVQCDMDKDRFKGAGDAGGMQLDIEGRVDPADPAGRVVSGARLVATYETSDGHHGRIVGERNGDPPPVHGRN